jgi:hypothetical protein
VLILNVRGSALSVRLDKLFLWNTPGNDAVTHGTRYTFYGVATIIIIHRTKNTAETARYTAQIGFSRMGTLSRL